MTRGVLIAAGFGLVAALFYLSIATGQAGSLILLYLVQLPLFMAGLWLGTGAALVAGGTATAVALVAGGLMSGLLFGVTEAGPVAVLVRQALLSRRDERGTVVWYPSGRLAVCLVGLGAAALIAAALATSGSPGGLKGTVHSLLAEELRALFADGAASGATAAQRADAVAGRVAPFFPGAAVLSWLMLLAINGVLAQGALARFGLTWRPSPDIAALTLPKALPAAALLCGALAAVPGTVGYLGLNLVLVLSIAFFFAGLAVVHALARRLEARLFMLIAFYAVLFFGWPVLVVAGLGFLEPWVGLRRRFAATAPGQGEM